MSGDGFGRGRGRGLSKPYKPLVLDEHRAKQKRLQKPLSSSVTDLPSDLASELDPVLLAAIAGDLRSDRPPPLPAHMKEKGVGGHRDVDLPSSSRSDDSKDELMTLMVARMGKMERELKTLRDSLHMKEGAMKALRAELRHHQSGESDLSQLREENAVLKIQNTRLMHKVVVARRLLQSHGIDGSELDEEVVDLDSPTPAETPRTGRRRSLEEAVVRSSGSAPILPTNLKSNEGAQRRTSVLYGEQAFDWKGSYDVSKAQPMALPAVAGAESKTPVVPFDKRRLFQNVRELNEVSGDEKEFYSADGKQHILRTRKSIPLVFYADGVVVNDGPFRPYTWPTGQAIVSDLIDGYFPYEFKQQHPDGVPLEAIDKTNEMCPQPAKEDKSKVRGVGDLGDHGYRVLSKQNFLNKLPKQVIKNGKVVEVRSEIDKLLAPPIPQQGGNVLGSAASAPQIDVRSDDTQKGQAKAEGQKPIVVSTEALDVHVREQDKKLEAEREKVRQARELRRSRGSLNTSPVPDLPGPMALPGAAGGHGEITVVQVKCPPLAEVGKEMLVFVVHMFYHQTIGDLYRSVRLQMERQSGGKTHAFRLFSAIPPPKAYTDEAQTLEAAELVPTATVMVRLS